MIVPLTPGGYHDQMRQALARCSFLPGSSHKRFARQVSQMHLHMISAAQLRHLIRLAWRYRRQMPNDLVPSKDAVDALDAAWRMEPEISEKRKVHKRTAPANPPLLKFMEAA